MSIEKFSQYLRKHAVPAEHEVEMRYVNSPSSTTGTTFVHPNSKHVRVPGNSDAAKGYSLPFDGVHARAIIGEKKHDVMQKLGKKEYVKWHTVHGVAFNQEPAYNDYSQKIKRVHTYAVHGTGYNGEEHVIKKYEGRSGGSGQSYYIKPGEPSSHARKLSDYTQDL